MRRAPIFLNSTRHLSEISPYSRIVRTLNFLVKEHVTN